MDSMEKQIKKVDVDGWPKVEGRYEVGNPKSCVAVCTIASIEDIKLPMDKIAITGKTVTENIGIEKIVENTVTNPNIRFLILCGNESKGHFVGQAICSLVENGLDGDKRIIGAKGPMPHLKNLDENLIGIFRKQITPIDIVGELDPVKIEAVIDEHISKDPGAFDGNKVEISEKETIMADYDPNKQFTADEKPDENWFTIYINKDKKQIIVEHYIGYGNKSELHCKIVGDTAASIAGTIVKMKKINGLYNAAYLGKELQKAEIALKKGLDYEQEKELA